MLPLGMVMLAQDVPFIKRLIDHLLAWIERKHPKWLVARVAHSAVIYDPSEALLNVSVDRRSTAE
jgi:hypothetical protein